MTDQFPHETPPSDEPFTGSTDAETPAEEPTPEAREWMSQLESMIRGVATQAAPVAKEIGAKAAELAAVAAVKAGPAAHRAAELTTEYGAKFAERAQSVAADLRSQAAADVPANGSSTNGSSTNGHALGDGEPSSEETTGTGV
jgi:hypothetical protein